MNNPILFVDNDTTSSTYMLLDSIKKNGPITYNSLLNISHVDTSSSKSDHIPVGFTLYSLKYNGKYPWIGDNEKNKILTSSNKGVSSFINENGHVYFVNSRGEIRYVVPKNIPPEAVKYELKFEYDGHINLYSIDTKGNKKIILSTVGGNTSHENPIVYHLEGLNMFRCNLTKLELCHPDEN